ncbi:MAG: tRNA (cytidine(56)-2'-O)-methyltransferase [Methanosarcinaceae archaeon]|nr:tRNA (cytidine(56)-2'-O)-methyltransferase [Methanosarcinaceae archaeon]
MTDLNYSSKDTEIVVLRLGHRPFRDKRITTHVGLTARALGASKMLLASDDEKICENISSLSHRFGGNFEVVNNVSALSEIKKWKREGGKVCHLSMYGINLPDAVDELKQAEKLMFVVGAEKVPGEYYEISDWNVAVGNQPHSEVAALAIAMDRISKTDVLKKKFDHPVLDVIPTKKGKNVLHHEYDESGFEINESENDNSL